MDEGRRLVSISDAAEIASVSRRTLYNWIAIGRLEYVRTAGGSIRIFVDSLFRGKDGQNISREMAAEIGGESRTRTEDGD